MGLGLDDFGEIGQAYNHVLNCDSTTPLQLAFAQAGTELAQFIIDHLYNIYQTIFGHDGVNTFNTIDRGAGAEALRLCPVTADLLPAYRLKYGNNRTLVFDRNTSSFDIDGTPVRSCVGPQQGDTWGTLICSVAHHRSFSLTQIRSPSATLIGFADDGHFADRGLGLTWTHCWSH